MHKRVRKWLEEDVVDVFIGYIKREGHVLPHIFTKDDLEACDRFHTGVERYPLEEIALEISKEQPDLRIGILTRDCTKRSLNVLSTWNQMDQQQMTCLDVSCCPSRLQEHAQCSYLNPKKPGSLKSKLGIDPSGSLQEVETLDQEERFNHWQYEFSKCIKCYGCRDICPVCFCQECSLEHTDLVHSGELLTEVPIFHLVRAVHMAGRCIDCGLCEEACPMNIPLRLLYRKVNEIVLQTFEYQTGMDAATPPLNILGQEVTLQTAPL
jgi:ferredoxin